MGIMSMLAAVKSISFTDLRNTLNMSDGNLITHIRTLRKNGYVSTTKSFHDNRPLTTCSLTEDGRNAFAEYVNLLEGIVKQARKSK